MRPRRARLGCLAPHVPRGIRGPCASMRPRRARLGCKNIQTKNYYGVVASMRPRRARLGCGVKNSTLLIGTECFNEAEARAPRMHWLRGKSPTILYRFNEAEARAPRMRGALIMTQATPQELQ